MNHDGLAIEIQVFVGMEDFKPRESVKPGMEISVREESRPNVTFADRVVNQQNAIVVIDIFKIGLKESGVRHDEVLPRYGVETVSDIHIGGRSRGEFSSEQITEQEVAIRFLNHGEGLIWSYVVYGVVVYENRTEIMPHDFEGVSLRMGEGCHKGKSQG
jgi:hypothetical protein